MYISNNSNIGMATLLQQQQQNKTCMKTLTAAAANTNGNASNRIVDGASTTFSSNKLCWQQHFEADTLRHANSNNTTSNSSSSNMPMSDANRLQDQPQHQQQQQQQRHVGSVPTAVAIAPKKPSEPMPAAGATTPNAEGTATANSNAPEQAAEENEAEPEIDIMINNVVCSFSVRCHLNLRDIALKACNVEYRRENGMVTMKLRRPYTTASIWSSGRITCTGATSEVQAKVAARRYARCLEKLGFRARFQNFRVVNVLGTCSMPWAIKIVNFSEKYKKEASYEPELHPGVTYKLRYPKATLKIFSTGSITVTAASVANVQAAIEHIYPLVHEFRKKRSPEEQEQLRLKKLHAAGCVDITDTAVPKKGEAVAIDDAEEEFEDVDNANKPAITAENLERASRLQRKRPNASGQQQHNTSPTNNKRTKLSNGNSGEAMATATEAGFEDDIIEYCGDVVEEDEDADDPAEVKCEDDDDDGGIIQYSEFDDLDDLIEGPDDEEFS